MTTTSDTPMDDTQLADEAAPLDALLVDAALGPLRRFAPNASSGAASSASCVSSIGVSEVVVICCPLRA